MPSSEVQKRLAIETHSAQADKFAASYVVGGVDSYAGCFVYSRRRLWARLEAALPAGGPGRRALDVGCGTGYYLGALRERGFEVAGVDGSEEMLKHARASHPGVDLQRGDVESLPFPTASFDLVLCVEVLRYLPDPTACIAEMARVLRPGGVCLTTATPLLNLNGYWLVNRAAGLLPFGRLTRLRQFFSTSWGLPRDFTRAGFARTDVHGVYIGPINWIERLAPWALPRVLKTWEGADAALADAPVLRELANMFLVQAVKG
jgi:ubiquinone/menaquinone biosynthesis C-methylase UbiE